ncbi:TnsD family Tn7-like transposition protein [Caballeronia arvi]
MPSSLRAFHSSIGHLYCSVETLLGRHTHFDYYCRGLPQNRLGEQRARLLGKLPGPVRLCRLPVLFTPSEGEYLICADCRRAAADRYPFEYVHRNHVAPFVTVCALHGGPLESPSRQGLLFDQLCRSSPTRHQLLYAIEFAGRTADCVDDGLFGVSYQKDNVVNALTEAGWIAECGRIHLIRLIEEFQLFFASSFSDERLSMLLSSHGNVESALRALTRPDRALHPVWCILFAWFAQECSHWQRTATNRTRRPTAFPEDRIIRELLEKHGSLTRVAREVGVDPHRLSLRCRVAAISVVTRARRVDESQLQTMRSLLREGGRPDDVAQTMRVSVSTVYRVLAASPDLQSPRSRAVNNRVVVAKRHWLSLCRRAPNAGVTNLRAKAPAAYAQLRRNAPSWLSTHSPRAQRTARRSGAKAPVELTRTLSLAAGLAATDCSRVDRPPLRRSRYRLQQKLGISEYALASTEVAAMSTSSLESRDQAIANRVDWAGRRLAAGLASPPWRLGKVANLRSATVERELNRLLKSPHQTHRSDVF